MPENPPEQERQPDHDENSRSTASPSPSSVNFCHRTQTLDAARSLLNISSGTLEIGGGSITIPSGHSVKLSGRFNADTGESVSLSDVSVTNVDGSMVFSDGSVDISPARSDFSLSNMQGNTTHPLETPLTNIFPPKPIDTSDSLVYSQELRGHVMHTRFRDQRDGSEFSIAFTPGIVKEILADMEGNLALSTPENSYLFRTKQHLLGQAPRVTPFMLDESIGSHLSTRHHPWHDRMKKQRLIDTSMSSIVPHQDHYTPEELLHMDIFEAIRSRDLAKLEQLSCQHGAYFKTHAHKILLWSCACRNEQGETDNTILSYLLDRWPEYQQTHQLNLSRSQLEDSDMSIALFVQWLQTLSNRLTALNLSDNQLEDVWSAKLFASLFSQPFPKLTVLNLSNNQISNLAIKALSSHLKHLPTLQTLQLFGNCIRSNGARHLFSAVSDNHSGRLVSIDLSDNRLYFGSKTLQEHRDELSQKCEALRAIQVSHNFLPPDCSRILRRNSLFRSPAARTASLLDPKESCTSQNWVVAFVIKKDVQHAMLYLEGCHEHHHQKFLVRYHIVARHLLFGKGVEVLIEERPPSFLRDKHRLKAWPISCNDGKTLEAWVKEQKQKEGSLSFNKLYASTKRDTINCVKWCKDGLSQIDRQLPSVFLETPQAVVRGSNCLLM